MSNSQVKPGRRAVNRAAATCPDAPAEQRMRRRLRPQLAPHYAVTALVLAGCAARAAVYLTGEQAIIAMAVAAAAFVTAVIGSFVARKRLNGKRTKRWAAICIWGAASWLTTIAATGLTLDAVGLLAALGYALAMPWWRTHRIPNTPPVPAAPEVPATADIDLYPLRWAENLGKGGELSGSRLITAENIPAGFRYMLQLVPGKQAYSGVIALTDKIRTGLRLTRRQDLVIERHPDPNVDESCLLVTVVTRPPVSVGKLDWPGPSVFNGGCVELGPYVDGEGNGRWRVYTENSMWGGFITGITGVGKSRVLDAISLAAVSAGHTVVWYADGKDGASSPGLADWYDWCTDRDGAKVMLATALLIMKFRYAENLVDGVEGFTPSPERPGLLIILDECHAFFTDPEMQAAAATISREGRGAGVAIIGASQTPNVGVFGPGTLGNVIRSCLLAGNLAAMHTTQKNAGNLIPGLPIDPCTLPNIPGYVFLAARGPHARDAALRAYYVDDTRAESDAIPMVPLDRGSATAGGQNYRVRRAAADARLNEARALVDALRNGRPAPNTRRPASTNTNNAAPAAAVVAATARFGQVIAFPTFSAARPAAPAAQLTESQQAVLAAIAAGCDRPSTIQPRTGLSERQVHNLLGQLQGTGHLTQPGYGRYALTDAGQHELSRAS